MTACELEASACDPFGLVEINSLPSEAPSALYVGISSACWNPAEAHHGCAHTGKLSMSSASPWCSLSWCNGQWPSILYFYLIKLGRPPETASWEPFLECPNSFWEELAGTHKNHCLAHAGDNSLQCNTMDT